MRRRSMSRKTHKRNLHKKLRSAIKNASIKFLGIGKSMKVGYGAGLRRNSFKNS